MERIQSKLRTAPDNEPQEVVLTQLRLENSDLMDQVKRLQNMLNEPPSKRSSRAKKEEPAAADAKSLNGEPAPQR